MTDRPKIALVIGSTRATRWADKPAQWMLKQMQARDDLEVELVDLRDFDLPLFNEAASTAYMPSSDPRAVAWQDKIKGFDGYVFVVAEYNHSITGSLKNALDQAYVEWVKKPMAAIGYGGVGAARAIEHLRNVGVELQMVPVRNAVHIGGGDFYRVGPYNPAAEPIEAIEGSIGASAKATLDDVVWWAKATMAARATA